MGGEVRCRRDVFQFQSHAAMVGNENNALFNFRDFACTPHSEDLVSHVLLDQPVGLELVKAE